jgi:hypothetical protein
VIPNPALPLELTGRYFSVMPCPSFIEHQCTWSPCREQATHRVLSRATASLDWLCDDHALAWARLNGCIPE